MSEFSICIIAGEASGDVHGAHLVQTLREEIKAQGLALPQFWGAAGAQMRGQGVEAIAPVEELAVMGATEILSSYFKISNFYKKLLHEVELRRPKAIICIDYPGFNLRFIQDAFARGFTVIYHIPPKIWSHGAGRGEILRKNTHLVNSILPFEIPFFQERKIPVTFVGNPLLESVESFIREQHISQNKVEKNIIGLLPGSRKKEIEFLLPLMVRAFFELKKNFPSLKAHIPVASTISDSYIQGVLQSVSQEAEQSQWKEDIEFKRTSIYEVLLNAQYAWVCSGTATLEAAFCETPMSVVYRVHPLTAFIARCVLTVKYVSLVNLTQNTLVVPEFLQEKATVANLVAHAQQMLSDTTARQDLQRQLANIKEMYRMPEKNAAAKAILRTILCYDVPEEKKFRKLSTSHR